MSNKINIALIKAAEFGDEQAVISLLHQGADVNFEDQYSSTAIMRSSYNGHVGVSRILLDAGFHDEIYLNVAILNAAKQGHAKIVEDLIHSGADKNARDFFTGETPMMYAVKEGNTDVVKALLSHDADTSLQDHKGYTAFDMVRGNLVIDAMLQCAKDQELLMYDVDEMFMEAIDMRG